MKFLINLQIKLFCKKIGVDQYGNKYYEKISNKGKNKRYVIYNGIVESSKIPPMWHAWLHYIENKVPTMKISKYSWQKEHVPNLTGTIYATKPQGSLSKLGKRKSSHADYVSWKPK